MPLDQVIYANSPSAGGAYLWAVRGGQVYKYDPSNASLLDSGYFDRTWFSTACIAYDAINDKLLCGGPNQLFSQVTLHYGGPHGFFRSQGTLFAVNPATLVLSSSQDLFGLLNPPSFYLGTGTCGVMSMKWMGVGAYEGLWGKLTTLGQTNAFRYVTGFAFNRKGDTATGDKSDTHSDIAWDQTNSLMYFCRPWFESVNAYDMTLNNPANWPPTVFNTWTSGGATVAFGIEWCPNSGDAYYTTQLGTVVRIHYAAGVITFVTSINSTVTGICFHMRYNPTDGYLYYPVPSADKVAVIDPQANAVVRVVSGFDSPWDVVFTPTKIWVVQLANIGLKELI